MSLPPALQNLALPVIGSPLFIASNPTLVVEQCKGGIVGSFPALNARPKEELERWIDRIESELAAHKAAHPDAVIGPYAVNQIVHKSNDRLDHDLEVCIRRRVPVIISSLRAPNEIIPAVHGYGGVVLHDVINIRHAQKALEAGVDGLILVCAGAGGHAGSLSPFALLGEIRKFYDGCVVLAGAITRGDHVLAAQAMGADLAYMGTRWIATPEANVSDEYRRTIVESAAADIVYTDLFTGVHGNYLRASVVNAGLDPMNLPKSDPSKMNFGSGGNQEKKAWRDIWSAGQGVGQIDAVQSTAEVIAGLKQEYAAAKRRICL
jgi:nitronate monooxygenase